VIEEKELLVSKKVDPEKEGLYFIINKKNIEVLRKRQNALISYTITISDMDEEFNININGKIKVNDMEEIFVVDETYPNSMMENVLNAFNIRELIKIFNLLYMRYYSDQNKPDDNRDIDDYLSGKIKND
jgi:hypothetical protein